AERLAGASLHATELGAVGSDQEDERGVAWHLELRPQRGVRGGRERHGDTAPGGQGELPRALQLGSSRFLRRGREPVEDQDIRGGGVARGQDRPRDAIGREVVLRQAARNVERRDAADSASAAAGGEARLNGEEAGEGGEGDRKSFHGSSTFVVTSHGWARRGPPRG